MSYSINFLDNNLVNAQTISALAEALGGDGSGFDNNTLYGVDHLNAIAQNLISPGVAEGCELSLEEGTVTIDPGTLFLPSGAMVTVEEPGITLHRLPGATNYVWFSFDEISGFAVPCCTDYAPGSSQGVMLGTISPSGGLNFLPDRAVMKNPCLGKNYTESHSIDLSFSGDLAETLVGEIPLEDVGATLLSVTAFDPTESTVFYRNNHFCGQVDLDSGAACGVLSTTADPTANGFFSTISQNGQSTLTVALCNYNRTEMHHKVNLRFALGTDNVLRIYRSIIPTTIAGAENLRSNSRVVVRVC